MADYKIIDSDAHMCEPFGLWQERLEHRFQERAPRLINEYKGRPGSFFVVGDEEMRISGAFAAGKTYDEKYLSSGLEAAPAGAFEPAARLKDMELDGVECAVLYPTFALTMFHLADPDFQQACFRIYNDWVAEFVSYAPHRFAGLGMISLHDPAAGAAELERCRKLGLKGGMIWAVPPEDQPYYQPIYDRVWAAAQALEMPLSLHTLTGRKDSLSRDSEPDLALSYTVAVSHPFGIQRTLLNMIFGAVLERFPGLRLVSAEAEINWVASLAQRADKFWRRRKNAFAVPLALTPGEYLARQLYSTFIDDVLGLKNYRDFAAGASNFMWSTDYPHQASTWPHSKAVLERDFPLVPEPDRRRIVRENAARLYGFRLD